MEPKKITEFFVAIFLTSIFLPPQLTTTTRSCTDFAIVFQLSHSCSIVTRSAEGSENDDTPPTITTTTISRVNPRRRRRQGPPTNDLFARRLSTNYWCELVPTAEGAARPESAVQERWTEETTTNTCKYHGRGRELRERERMKHLFFAELHLIEKLKHTNTLKSSFSVEMPKL